MSKVNFPHNTVSVDGGSTWSNILDLGAAVSTVTSAPVSGDGSIGSPITIAAGALTNASLATMAANSLKGNATGSTAAPTDITLSTGLAFIAGALAATLTTGLSGGQTIIGDTAASGNLTIRSTNNATKGLIKFDSPLQAAVGVAPAYGFADSAIAGIYYQAGSSSITITTNTSNPANSITWNGANMIIGSNGSIFFSVATDCQIGRDAGTGMLIAKSNNGVAFATAAFATAATTKFPQMPSCPGPPTGVPNPIFSGQIPWIYDSTNDKLYAYNGSWKSVQLT